MGLLFQPTIPALSAATIPKVAVKPAAPLSAPPVFARRRQLSALRNPFGALATTARPGRPFDTRTPKNGESRDGQFYVMSGTRRFAKKLNLFWRAWVLNRKSD